MTTLVNQPSHVVGEAVGEFFGKRKRDDLALLYFTGHGLKDDDGRLYLAMTNTRRDGLLFTGLSADQVNDAMSRSLSRQKVLILDCCYSGAFPAGRPAKADQEIHTLERFRGRGRVVLTATDATQYAFEGDVISGSGARSVFTRFLVEGIRSGNADLDGDGEVALDELYSYVHDRVTDEMPQQRPKKQEDVEGRIYISHNINWSLPRHLRDALDSPLAAQRLAAVESLGHLARIGNESVRRITTGELRKLSDDDSKAVSSAAGVLIEKLSSTKSPPASEPRSTPRAAAANTRPSISKQARPTETIRQRPTETQPPPRSPTPIRPTDTAPQRSDPPRRRTSDGAAQPPVATSIPRRVSPTPERDVAAEKPAPTARLDAQPQKPHPARRAITRPEVGAIAAAIAIFIFFFTVAAPFRTIPAFSTVLYAGSTIGIVAVGVGMLMIGGEFDLSAGVIVTTAGLATAMSATSSA